MRNTLIKSLSVGRGNCLYWTDSCAGATIDALVWIDPACIIFFADCLNWAFALASATISARITYFISHISTP